MQSVRQLAHRLSLMPPENEVRRKHEKLLLDKLYDMGVLSSASKLSGVEHGATVSAFARRRLPVVMTRLRMAENIVGAILYSLKIFQTDSNISNSKLLLK